MRLKNTLEVALVLDNSGSMSTIGTGSGKERIDLLKEAAKQLVETLANQADMMKQIAKPVQFALVPFSASVNIGPDDKIKAATWMDQDGISPIHHENFDWTSFTDTNKKVSQGCRRSSTTRRAPVGERKRTRKLRASRSLTK